MKKFEELMDIPYNLSRFCCLKNELQKDRLAVFFGAGLSLGERSTTWGYPFNWAYAKLQDVFHSIKDALEMQFRGMGIGSLQDILNHPQTNEEEDIQKAIFAIQQKLNDARTHINNKEFLNAGDALSQLLELLKELHSSWALPDDLFEHPIRSTTFNSLLVAAFTEDNYRSADEMFPSPYSIPAIFYLPYLGPFIITTNVEKSFDSVVERLGFDQWHRSIITPLDNVDDWDENRYSVFYIHGHIKRPDSLIMTAKQYKKMYPTRIAAYDAPRGARALLSNTVSKYSILFLGASLQTDQTVQVINYVASQPNVSAQRNDKDLHFIPIAEADEYGRLVKPDSLLSRTPIRFSEGQYSEISSILLQLIRETKKDWPHCKWYEPTFPPEPELFEIPNAVQERIADSLGRSNDYELIPIDDIDDRTVSAQNLIRYLYAHHSVSRHDEGKGWSICCISENEFSLGEPDSQMFPLHNYPVGDTIYVLFSLPGQYGHYSLYSEAAYQRILPSIERWLTSDCPFYPNMERDREPPNIHPRVRVIVLPLPPSPMAQERISSIFEQQPEITEIVDEIDDFLKENAFGQGLSTERKRELSKNNLAYLWKLFKEIAGVVARSMGNINIEEITNLLDRTPVMNHKR